MSTSINPIKSSKLSIRKDLDAIGMDEWFFSDLDWSKHLPTVEPFDESSVFLSELSHSAEEDYDVDLYIIAGQSNALGSALISDLPESELSHDCLFFTSWHSDTSNAETSQFYSNWVDGAVAGNTRGGSTDLFGPEIGFASKMAQLNNSGKKIAILKYAVGASQLNAGDESLSDWDTLESGFREGDCWDGLQRALQNGINKLVSIGYSYRIRGMLWWQGESGSSVDGLKQFISSTRSLIDQKYESYFGLAMPFVITKIGYGTDLTPVADEDPNISILDAAKYGHSAENNHIGSGENNQPLDTNENGLNDMLDAGKGFASLMYQLSYSESDGLDELSSLYDSSDINWKIRIGKGGQLYSLKIGDEEQLICPQHRYTRDDVSKNSLSPWNDDCMTSVVQSGNVHVEDEYMKYSNGFIHGSAMYIKPHLDPINNKPFNNPLLGENFNGPDKSYTVINLGTIPSPSVNRPDVLFYHKYRDLGTGVLEITFFVYNFGATTWGWANMPWFGLRRSTLPDQIYGRSDGTYVKRNFKFGTTESNIWINEDDYGGWNAKTENISSPSTSKTISHVTGNNKYDSELGTRLMMRPGVAGNEIRDMQLLNLAWHNFNLPPGTSGFKRAFFVFGDLNHAVETSQNLVNKVEYGYPEISNETTINLYNKTINGHNILTKEINDSPAFKVYNMPINDSAPLFLIKDNSTDEYIVTTDPYLVCEKAPFTNPYPVDHENFQRFNNRTIYKPYDGKTEWIELLGYVKKYDANEISTGYIRLSDLLSNINFKHGELINSTDLMTKPL